MNEKEAAVFHQELEKIVEKQAVDLGFEKNTGANLVNQYVEMYPDSGPMLGLIDLNPKGSASVKPGNILVNQKALLLAGLDWALAFGTPDSVLNYVQLFLLTSIAIYKSLKVDLNESESHIVLYLHLHQMYEQGEVENVFYRNFQLWFKNQTGDEISDIRLKEAVDNLLTLKCIAIEEGEIRLKEKVWY